LYQFDFFPNQNFELLKTQQYLQNVIRQNTKGIVASSCVMVSSPSDSPMISLSGEYDSTKNSQGVTPSEGDL